MLFRFALGAVLLLGAIGGWIIAAGPSFMTGATTGNYVAADKSGRPTPFVCKTINPDGGLSPCSPEAYERTRRRLEEVQRQVDEIENVDIESSSSQEAPPADEQAESPSEE